MSYWKGLLVAAAIDLIWIAGCPLLVTEPELAREGVSYVAETAAHDVAELEKAGRLEDSVMVHLQNHSDDVATMELLAHSYTQQGWYDQAIRPLARALQLDPARRSLWVALDEAIEKSGRGTISDAELGEAAQEFVEAIEMWGMGC